MKKSFYSFPIYIVLCGIFLLSARSIYSQDQMIGSEDDRTKRGSIENSIKYKPKYENTESEMGTKFFKKSEKPSREPWVDALHEARRNGDEKLMREIEAQHRPKNQLNGEVNGKATIRISGTVGYPGEPKDLIGNSSESPMGFGTDIHVRSVDTDFRESYPAMATASDGTIYIVWENVGQPGTNDYVQVYYSTDGGDNWVAYGYVENPSYNLREPTLAIGEGGDNVLIIAYIVDDGVCPFPEVATSPLISSGFSWTIRSVPYWNWWEGYAKPNLWTDSYDWYGWYGNLTCEGIMVGASGNYNVCYWRSVDYGSTWQDEKAIFGDTDAEAWRDPDGTYGTTGNNLFVACFNQTDNTLYTVISYDFGYTWADTIAINTMTDIPFNPVDPDIEAATNYNNVMLCCTKSFSGADNAAQIFSSDGGYTWSILYSLEGYTPTNEFAVELTANEGGNNWHVCYTSANWWIYYSTRPQDLSDFWQAIPDVVNDVDWASAAYPKKAITSNWGTDIPGIAWSDYRQGAPDYDIYFDHGIIGEPDINVTPTTLVINQTASNILSFESNYKQTNTQDLFIEISKESAELNNEQRYLLSNFESLESSVETKLVTSNIELLKSDDALNLKLFYNRNYTAVKTRVELRGGDDFSWFGKIAEDPDGSIIIVAINNELTGSIRIKNENYAIRSLGGIYHVVIRQDLSNLPPDHPPEFERILKEKIELNLFIPDLWDNNFDDGSVIDVLVAYTPSAASASGNINALIQLAVDESNQSYMNSSIFPRINLVYSYQVTYTESGSFSTDLIRFQTPGDGYMDEVHTHRDNNDADVCVLIINDLAYCGLASTIMADESTAFCLIHWDCATGYYSFSHEIGHLQGARHNPEEDPTTTPFPYGHGYLYIPGGWRTVMAYNNASCPGGYCNRIQYWSNPDVNYGGIPTGTASTHDNARVLDETALTVSNFRVSSVSANTFVIENVGTATLSVTSITDNRAWLLHSGYPTPPFDIAPGGSQLVAVSVDWNLISTSETGIITIASNDPDEPTVTVDVTANPGLPAGPIIYDSYIVDDDNSGNSSGNSDGIINPGESIELYVSLFNAGTPTVTGVNATISDDSPYTTYTFNTISDYGDIPGLSLATNLDDFDISIDPSTPDGHKINFTLDITASNGGPWTQYFSIAVDAFPPDIDITPLSFTFNVAQGGSDFDILTISNTAATNSQSLNYHIFDYNVTVELADGRKFPTKLEPSIVDVTEVILSKENNSNNIENVKSRSSYYYEDESISLIDHLLSIQAIELNLSSSSTATIELDQNYIPTSEFRSGVLYDNGPLVNSPGTGVGGADESVLQNVSLGMSIIGFGHQVYTDIRIADDFTVTDPAGWIIDAFKFYAYQTGSTTFSTITAVNYRIWDGPPDNPSSTIIYGDPFTNRLLTTDWSNVYRVTETMSGTSADRPVMENTVSAGIYLPPGTYWLDWQSDGTLLSGPWAPPITINGQTSTGNGLQWYSSAWGPAMDIGQQGFPFLITGTAGSDCPWLTHSPVAGEIPPGSNQLVEVIVDATGLSAGSYNANLIITSNDPDENPIEMPVTLNVLSTATDWAANLLVEDNCGNFQELTFGTAPDATDGFDPLYDLYAPPLPPVGAFDARFIIGGEDFINDFRATIADAPIVWDAYYQESSGCNPVSLYWSPAELPDVGVFRLIDAGTGGSLVNVNMRTQAGYTDNLALGHLQIIYSWAVGFEKGIIPGWNLLGLPLAVEDKYYLSLFPNSLPGTLYGFNGSYYPADSLQICTGYWLRFPDPEIVEIIGTPMPEGSPDLILGWNMVSGISCDVALSDVGDPGGIIIPGTLFGFDGAYYLADSIKQGTGYWIRTSSAGSINFNCATILAKGNSNLTGEIADLTDFSVIEVSDESGSNQTLYFNGKLDEQILLESFSLPPMPPVGSFDARLLGGYRVAEADEVWIHVQSSSYPLSIKMSNLEQEEEMRYMIIELIDNTEVGQHPIAEGVEIMISNPEVQLLKISKVRVIPLEFEVSQNYPNPFNPTTQIQYGLPKAGNVELIIYNTVGEKVRTLVSEIQQAGYYTVEWNGTNDSGYKVGSGIYLYSLKSDDYYSVKKMILLK